MLLADWHWLVGRAKTHEALVSVCNDYLASWTPQERDRLPTGCRPVSIQSTADIANWVHVLSDWLCRCDGNDPAAAAVGDMLAFLFSANDRAQEIAPSAPVANDDGHAPLTRADPAC